MIENNSFISNQVTSFSSTGSVIYLENPSNITISSSLFINNVGVLGSCIYYQEGYSAFFPTFKQNTFIGNNATIEAGGVFYSQIDKKVDININISNNFSNNSAKYSNDFSTPPFRLKKIGNMSIIDNYPIIPGITNLYFTLEFRDFFDQRVTNSSKETYCSFSLVQYPNFEYLKEVSIEGSSAMKSSNDGLFYFP